MLLPQLFGATWYEIGYEPAPADDWFSGLLYYDMSTSGLSSAQYVKILTNETDQNWVGVDLDAVGVIHTTAPVPAPGTLALIFCGMLGFVLNRMKHSDSPIQLQ